MSALQAVVLALIQGATELFPVSSLGHAVILPHLLGWNVQAHTQAFLPFLVMLHVGTATALLAYFWRDWWAIGLGVLGLADPHQSSESRRVFALIVVATIPAVILGFTLEKFFRALFGAPVVAAAFLVVNGVTLLLAERLRARGHRPLSGLGLRDALIIGVCQSAALFPGISRSGAAMAGGLVRGVDHEGAAHFSFLIATPIIAGAAVLEVPKMFHGGFAAGILPVSALAAVVAGVTAYASTAFLMKYFRDHETWALAPFAYYCLAFGIGSLGLIAALG